jgi:hypothetical protein
VDFKLNNAISHYFTPRDSTSSPSCCHVTVHVQPQCSFSKSNSTLPGKDTVFPSTLIKALSQAILVEDIGAALRLVVADMGATNHMLPDRSAFISYKSIRNLCVRMGNNSFAPVLGWGKAIISLNRQRLLIHNVLHVPALRVPLYSLRAHLHQPGCGFVGSHVTRMHAYFPGVVLSIDTSTDCHLS